MPTKTEQQYDSIIEVCKDVFVKKMHDYGTSWRILRPESLTDQILIKASRIRSIQMKPEKRVDEGERSEFVGILNYAVMALIQLKKGFVDSPSMNHDEAMALYDEQVTKARRLMNDKNHDYDEAWRKMRVSSITDLILMKLYRTKEIENNAGATLISEGVDANYLDILNYAAFALIKTDFPEN